DRDHDGDGLVADTWYHLTVSFGMGHMMFYIDGELVKDWDNVPDASILDISADPVNLTFGQDLPTALYADDDTHNVAWGGFFKGTMDDIMIYNRVLSADEVMALKEMEDDYEEPVVPGLVASYPFNGDAEDASGNGNDGEVMMGHSEWGAGTPMLTTDRFGEADKAYHFDEGGNIEVPYSTILNPSSMSISWWISMEEQANNDYMISMSRWNCYKVNLQDVDRVFFTTRVEDPETPGEYIYSDRDHDGDGLMADTWYHLAVSFGMGHMKFYIDGVLVKDWDNVPDASILDISADPVNLTFGQDLPTALYADDDVHNVAWGGFFKGKMDDIQIYNVVLSDAEVLALFGDYVPISIEDHVVGNGSFELKQNYPNPFSSSTSIEYSQKEKGFATLKVFNALGQEVVSLLSQDQNPGTYKYTLDASDLSAGVYFYQLSIDGQKQTKKLQLSK
ncbi:MAG: T9SS type A sorting domain-containing protein, partial [Bacteroides sp.]|nr:T9SS type A sorting domain-containing protein [Bacteroides sp.]